MSRQTRRRRQRSLKKMNPQTLQALGLDPNKDVSPLTQAIAEFREAVDFQQFMSEIVNHGEQSLMQLPEDHDVVPDIREKLATAKELYALARHETMLLGLAAGELLNPFKDEPLIEVPNLVSLS